MCLRPEPAAANYDVLILKGNFETFAIREGTHLCARALAAKKRLLTLLSSNVMEE